MRNALIVLMVATVAFFGWKRCGHGDRDNQPPPVDPPIPERLIILADTTNSLATDEIDATYKLVASVFRLAPEETEIIVYPIVAEVATVRHYEGRVPSAPVPAAQKIVREWRETNEAIALGMLQAVAASARSQDQTYASCISLGLQRAAGVMHQAGGGAKTDIIVISDMVEECRTSLFGGAVRLNRQDLTPFLRTADTMQPAIDLQGARVVTFFPSALSSGHPRVSRPDRAPLRDLWNKLLQRSNADMSRSRIDADHPQYFLSFVDFNHQAIRVAEELPPRLGSEPTAHDEKAPSRP